MRIIGGDKGGITIQAPTNLPVRPTTDRAKESLFNILQNQFNFEDLSVLELFAGTGNISYEFASRGAQRVMSVDKDAGCVMFMKQMVKKLAFNTMEVRKQDAFTYLQQCHESFHIIFADAPYALPRISELPSLIFDKGLLLPNGMLILEHGSLLKMEQHPRFKESRAYGQSTFTFFM
ncbi:MAG: RsmD family RNA methyltransferase [Bacteroidota bacterium]|nr:RsmD family RNA methyltransferase [Bacteroidota bacterium]